MTNSHSPSSAASEGDISERLRKEAFEAVDWNGETMKQWDKIRALCAERDGSDLPRLMFESLIDSLSELMIDGANEIDRLRQVMRAPAQTSQVRLEARPADNSKEWTEIFPAQLEWVAKAGHRVRAIELAAQPPAAPVCVHETCDDQEWCAGEPKCRYGSDADLPTVQDVRGILGDPHDHCDAPAQCSAATGDAEMRLKGTRQEIVDYIDSGADRGRVAGVPQGALEDWFDNLETVSGLIRAVPQPVGDRYVHIDNVVYHLDDVEVDADGKCAWADVANALTHIKLCIEIRTASCPLPRPHRVSEPAPDVSIPSQLPRE